jgi:hypothetical protein
MTLPAHKNVWLPGHSSNRFFGSASLGLPALSDSALIGGRCPVSMLAGLSGLSRVRPCRCCRSESADSSKERPLW